MDSTAESRFEEWLAPRASRLLRFTYLLCGDWYAAEDIVQDVLIKAAGRWRRIEATGQPDAYVRKMLANANISRWRRRVTTDEFATADMDRPTINSGDQWADREELLAALRRLPDKQRAIVVLRFFEQFTEPETAEIVGCSVGTVKSQTSKALANLRRTLTAEDLSC